MSSMVGWLRAMYHIYVVWVRFSLGPFEQHCDMRDLVPLVSNHSMNVIPTNRLHPAYLKQVLKMSTSNSQWTKNVEYIFIKLRFEGSFLNTLLLKTKKFFRTVCMIFPSTYWLYRICWEHGWTCSQYSKYHSKNDWVYISKYFNTCFLEFFLVDLALHL